MALMRWDPFAEIDALHGQLNDLFNDTIHNRHLAPVTDIYTEDDKQIKVEVHLPNFEEDEIDVATHDNALEIKAQHQEKVEDKTKRQYLVKESSSSFYRHIALPKQADEDALKAKFDKGVLTVTVPLKALRKPKKVAIGSGEKKSKK